ncbi:Pkinase-domain-containing protein [Lichtheimia hyalospora FSU 10163]|nr:Pkinase-domain-containing protein [Lichtheimia hyalospora FSU 10163]
MGLGGFFGRHTENDPHRCATATTTTANTVDHVSSARSSSSNQSSSVRSPSHSAVYTPQKPRFEVHADGTHSHCIRCMPTSKLSASLQNMASLLPSTKSFKIPLMGSSANSEKKALEALQKEREAINNELHRTPSDTTCLSTKWGTCHEVIGKGAFGVVRIVHKADPSGNDKGSCGKLYAVKEFRKKGSESTKQYVKRLTSEFCISSVMHHPNVIETLDLLPLNESSPVYCQVMEYCDAGDMFDLICNFAHNGLQAPEANCFFKQLMRGVRYMHSVGVAHRDLKPENLLLTTNGTLKISDFGGADCFQPSPDAVFMNSRGVCGSEPYIAPEMYTDKDYDPRLVDIWSCGVIYMAMRTGNHLWQVAKKGEDDYFDRYLKFRRLVEEERENSRRERLAMAKNQSPSSPQAEKDREASMVKARESIKRRAKESGLDVLEGLEFSAKRLVYRMLDPTPQKRITMDQIMQNEWFMRIYCCQPSLS